MPSSLGRRPQATVFSVEDLVMRVRRGEVRVPKFQRRLNWRAKDIRLLFDSLYRGYPIGSLLFWKREAPADSVKLGPITVDAPASRDAWWVVDGQQRITTLVGALLHPDPIHGRDDYALGIDLESEEFIRSRPSLPKSWMPLNIVLDTTKLLGWLDAYPLRAERPAHVTTAHRAAKALRDFQLPAYVIEEDDETLVRDVFGRLNSAGRKLKPDEVFDALAGSEKSGSASTLRAISDSVAELGFGRFERVWVLKSVQAVAGQDFTRSDVGALPRDKEALAAAQRALREVAVFLRRDAGILHASLLPYSLPIPILASFFHLHPEPHPRSRDLLARWLWRGAITGDHQGESIPVVRKMLAATKLPEEDAVQALLHLLSSQPTGSLFLAPFEWRSAWTKLEANALLNLGPRDFATGQPIRIPETLDADGASAFKQLDVIPYRALDRTERLDRRESPYGTLANRYFQPAAVDFISLLRKMVHRSDAEAILGSHALPVAETNALLEAVTRGSYTAFNLLTARDSLLISGVEQFLELKARWNETDRPSLDALTVPDA